MDAPFLFDLVSNALNRLKRRANCDAAAQGYDSVKGITARKVLSKAAATYREQLLPKQCA
jgi:hypothetical protein